MTSPTPKSSQRTAHHPGSAGKNTVGISPSWLFKALGVTLIAALICGYLTACLLFYQGQWQLVLHPSRSTPPPATIAGATFETVHFGVDESALPQLTGWYLPAAQNAAPHSRYARYTVLYLPGGDGSLADAATTLVAVHNLGFNLFAFDYRGYGQSAATHPNQQRMDQDAASAWQYLTLSRALPSGKIILFGSGVGASLAAQLAVQHTELPVVIFDTPRTDILETVLADPRTQFLPVRLLFHDRFDITGPAASLKTPKLLLFNDAPHSATTAATPAPGPIPGQASALVADALAPKMAVHLNAADRSGPVFASQLSRFLDEYLP